MMLGLVLVALLYTPLSAALQSYYMDQHCGGALSLQAQHTRSLSLRLTSNEEYGSNMNCYVTVIADEGSRIMMSFVWLDINSFLHCPGDFVQVMDSEDVTGNNTSSRNWTSSPVCGRQRPDVIMMSRRNSITIRFISDGHFFGHGFHAVLTQFHYGPCSDSEFGCDNGRCIHADLKCSNVNATTINSNNADDNGFDHCGDFSHRRRCRETSLSLQIIVCVAMATIVFAFVAFVLVAVAWYRLKIRHHEVDEDEGIADPDEDEDEGEEAGSRSRDNTRRDGTRDSPFSIAAHILSSFADLVHAAAASNVPILANNTPIQQYTVYDLGVIGSGIARRDV